MSTESLKPVFPRKKDFKIDDLNDLNKDGQLLSELDEDFKNGNKHRQRLMRIPIAAGTGWTFPYRDAFPTSSKNTFARLFRGRSVGNQGKTTPKNIFPVRPLNLRFFFRTSSQIWFDGKPS